MKGTISQAEIDAEISKLSGEELCQIKDLLQGIELWLTSRDPAVQKRLRRAEKFLRRAGWITEEQAYVT